MQDLAKYSFSNAKIRALLSFLVKPEMFLHFLEAKDVYEVLTGLKNTPYAGLVTEINTDQLDLKALEKGIWGNVIEAYRKTYLSLPRGPEHDFAFLLLERYEIEELKVILRIWHKKLPVDWKEYIQGVKIARDIDYRMVLASHTIEELILNLENTPYLKPLAKAKDKYKERNSLFYLEAALDSDYYRRLFELVEKFSSRDKKVAKKILGVEIDIENINWVIRLRKYYSLGVGEMLELMIPGGERIKPDLIRGSYSSGGAEKLFEAVALGPYLKIKEMAEQQTHFMENFLYEILYSEVHGVLRGFPFTIGTALGYLILKRGEAKNLISLIYGKSYNWPKEQILPLLSGLRGE